MVFTRKNGGFCGLYVSLMEGNVSGQNGDLFTHPDLIFEIAELFSTVLGGNRSRETWLIMWLILFKAPLTKRKKQTRKYIPDMVGGTFGIGIISMSISHSLQMLKISDCWISILHQPSTSAPPNKSTPYVHLCQGFEEAGQQGQHYLSQSHE